MRRWALQSLLILMLASLSVLPSLRAKISNIAATSTGTLRRIVLEDRVGSVLFGNYHSYHGAPTTTIRSTTSATESLSNKLLSPSSPLPPVAYQQGQTPAFQNQDQFSTMTSPEVAAAAAEQGSTSGPGAPASTDAHTEPQLPKLSAADFRAYNQLADMMNAYVSLLSPSRPSLSNIPTPNLRHQYTNPPQTHSTTTSATHGTSYTRHARQGHGRGACRCGRSCTRGCNCAGN
jgi:hypothetical protein